MVTDVVPEWRHSPFIRYGPIMQTVISIHGIKTRGKWQKDITPFLRNFVHEPLDFGNFLAIQLARRKSRHAQVDRKGP